MIFVENIYTFTTLIFNFTKYEKTFTNMFSSP